MKDTAQKLHVPVDELARAFLSYGALAHRTGELKLAPVLKPQRLTLFPEGWLSQSVPTAPVGKARRDQAWRSLVVYRGIPAELRETVKQTAAQLHVPVGEVAAAFLQHALTAYQTGKLLLQP